LLLQDILQNKDIHLDGILIASLVFDLLKVRPGNVSFCGGGLVSASIETAEMYRALVFS